MYELKSSQFEVINRHFPYLWDKTVIQGVLEANNRGRIFIDQMEQPKAALIWAVHEMYYFVGEPTSDFISSIESFLEEHIFPEAIKTGDDHFNLELYPFENWNSHIPSIFNKYIVNEGKRVPFTFSKEDFQNYINESTLKSKELSTYQFEIVTKDKILGDSSHILKTEIEKFWPSVDHFLSKGIGICVTSGKEIVGTCLSVYAYQNHYEIGINTYKTSHRGKGIATEMAKRFIMESLERGYIPHWTTESFRVDSIKVALKLGFTKHNHYTVYHFPLKE
ncbi:hypothetical protein JOC85_000441 [Bacillus mesophilus]|uniref:GNAT family N-acetyltransferase n=1 Tax=Bacillus mesophilus TaxID=1808955 RepID=A0A6M0Q533_9BACI|nr:GNAT family N-acetyltransferase [Bacillus mesophilus]MBM7659674.1 hypothetical protein [Bacillus mesophilus]NEY70540.1 GNAT family N-acetyltransferase [Bacillus mesophilus]